MGDPHEHLPQSSEIKHVLPDVVHSQQIPSVGDAVAAPTETLQIDTPQNTEAENAVSHDVDNISITESISEHIASKLEYSVTDSDNVFKIDESPDPPKVELGEKAAKHSSINVLGIQSPLSDNATQQSQQSASWPLEGQASPDVHPLSEESPELLASSELSKEGTDDKSLQESSHPSEHAYSHNSQESAVTPKQSPREDEYLDSLDEENSRISNISIGEDSLKSSQSEKIHTDKSSGSEEIIKLDIRGKGVPKFPLSTAKIIFGPPPEGSTVIGPNVEPLPMFQNLLSPFLVGAGDSMKVEDIYDNVEMPYKDPSLERSPEQSPEKDPSPRQAGEHSMVNSFSSDKIQQDVLIEEVTVDYETREPDDEIPERLEDASIPTQPKSFAPDETTSFSTLTTDYKTICEEYHVKLVHLEDAISQRDELIEELTISLQRSVKEQDQLRTENAHLTNEVQNLQHLVAEQSLSEHNTVKAQLSDFMKYESLVKDDSTKFYSALMSGGSSIQSSNGEKDNENEEITIHYSRSDLKSSSSDDFQTGFETKLTTVINKFDEFIEENLRNKLRESIIQVLCEEIGKMRIESDTELRDVETQLQQDKQAYTIETRRLRELLASVKAGNADIDALRQELGIKHEKEMENLRTYFEKKCSDMERSYSEEVWRGRACASPSGSLSSDEGGGAGGGAAAGGGAGDCPRRRTRSAEFPSLTYEPSQWEQALKQASKKCEQQIEELKSEHAAHITDLQASHAAAVAALELQITQLKAHIQTTENTEPNVSLYQQDIDLELEKKDFEKRLEEVRQEVAQELQNQIQVLLSDPDAEVSSWPLELVALREKIYDTRAAHDKEISGVREESLGGEADKWRARRNLSFDQNRQLEEVTKERDGLKRVAVTLQRVVSQLVAYCACAEDELNRTVLAQLLTRLHTKDESSIQIDEESRPTTPNLDLSSSVVSKGKHVHFAPDLQEILAELCAGEEGLGDGEGLAGFLAQQRDVSADIKRELEVSLKRLRNEAHDLLELSSKLAAHKRPETKMLESGDQVQITELVEQLDGKRRDCDHCELHRKTMEEAMAECLQRESLLRGDLEAAMIKIAQLMTSGGGHDDDLIAEGYGCGPQQPLSLPPRGARPRPDGSQSLDGSGSPRGDLRNLQQYADALQRERDDLQQQLEAANRQLRSTRQFVEEQASEREGERDEFARRLAELRGENARLGARLAASARILNEMHCFRLARCNCRAHDAHVEQLEAQTRDMNQIIAELETRKAATDDELKSQEEKVSLLREVIQNLENQLEQKTLHETEILEQLDQMKNTIDDRDRKMRALVGELEALRNQSLGQSEAVCVKCGEEDDRYEQLLERVREQGRLLEDKIHRSSARLERTHEVASASCSEPSEDVSVPLRVVQSPSELSPRACALAEPLPELRGVWECLEAHARVQEAAVKRIADLDMQRARLKQVAQEVRAERDVLQARMSEQALKISSLSARLQQQRNDAEALAQHAASQLTVRLHDTTAEVQRLKEELESKDKQIARMKLTAVDEKAPAEERISLYGNSCNPKDKVIILERELSQAQTRIAQLEHLARSLETDKEELQTALRSHQRALAEKEDQLQEILALNLNDINEDEKSEVEGKASARTLSDIVSISEFDEQDLQMRKAELRGQNMNLSGAPYDTNRSLNKTLPPEVQKPNMSSLNLDYADHFDLTSYSPRADSLPAHLTSTQNKDFLKPFKRNVNETTVFGTIDKIEERIKVKGNIPDNCSLYPNRDISDNKNVSVEPKKINFSLEASKDNKTQNDEEFTSLRELGITLDIKQENFPDILTQLKHEIKKSRSELEKCKSELKHAEEQLCEFPALKEEVEELKSILENTMATMDNDKKFYENQLENFSSNKKLLEQRLTELTQEINDKSKDLHLLKEDILRRENMILELAKEKRNLTNKMAEFEVKIDELQSRNNLLEKYESENHQMREKISELQKLEQLVTEKNQQIDSLNQHLDRHDDLQRCLNDKTEEFENLKEAYEEKSTELDHLQDTIDALNRDNAKLNQDNNDLINTNKDLKLKLTKVEKEHENASLRLQNSETEIERINSLNNELTSKLEELKQLTDKLKDKETEIEILHEDINSYHEEIATLKEQLKMVSRSPSPRKSGEEKRPPDRHASSDKKQLVKIRKQISLLQHELDFNKKDLNDKAFELAKAKLDVTELKSSVSQAQKQAADKEVANSGLLRQVEELHREKQALAAEKQALRGQLEMVVGRIREESSLGELKAKLQEQTERCLELEQEVHDLRGLVERLRDNSPTPSEPQRALVVSGTRSPTAELERALRDQLDYSHSLDEDILEQILSASSDEREREREDVPRLALNSSKSSSSIHSSSSERLQRARAESERLRARVNDLGLRLRDKDALIAELNRSVPSGSRRRGGCSARAESERLRARVNDLGLRLRDKDALIAELNRSVPSGSRRRGGCSARAESERLRARVNDLGLRLRDKDALIAELNRSVPSGSRRRGGCSARAESERLRARVNDLGLRLRDKDALIAELNRSVPSGSRRRGGCSARAESERLRARVNDLGLRLRDKDALIAELNRSVPSGSRRRGGCSARAESERLRARVNDLGLRLRDKDALIAELNRSVPSGSRRRGGCSARAESERLRARVNDLGLRLRDKDALIAELNRSVPSGSRRRGGCSARAESERLRARVNDLGLRLRDKDALIAELNRSVPSGSRRRGGCSARAESERLRARVNDLGLRLRDKDALIAELNRSVPSGSRRRGGCSARAESERLRARVNDLGLRLRDKDALIAELNRSVPSGSRRRGGCSARAESERLRARVNDLGLRLRDKDALIAELNRSVPSGSRRRGGCSARAESERLRARVNDLGLRLRDKDALIAELNRSVPSGSRRRGGCSARAESERLRARVNDLGLRLRDKDALIAELNRSVPSGSRRRGGCSARAESERLRARVNDLGLRLRDKDALIAELNRSVPSGSRRRGGCSARAESERLRARVNDLGLRLRDKDALIAELNRSVPSGSRRRGGCSARAESERLRARVNDLGLRLRDKDALIAELNRSVPSGSRRRGGCSARAESERLRARVNDLGLRLRDKDALIAELNRSVPSGSRRRGGCSARAESERLRARVNDLGLRLRDKDALIAELNRSVPSGSRRRGGCSARAESERLRARVNDLGLRLRDKDALIAELNRVRDKLLQECQTSKLQLETERDNSGRLQLLLDTQKETAESLQHQDSSMIQILKKRLESAMQSELELQQKEQHLRARVGQLERDLLGQGDGQSRWQHEMDANERLKGEIVLLKSRLESERVRYSDLQALLDRTKLQLERDLDMKTEACAALRGELVDLKRLKHDAGVELLRAKELLNIQASTIQQLESKLTAVTQHRPAADTLTEIESHKLSLAHDIASLKKCLADSAAPELAALRAERAQLLGRVQALEGARGAAAGGAGAEEKEQAIRYLHGRCLRLESSRKALVWQKRYLQRVLAGYEELERNLRLPTRGAPSAGVRRFKCVAVAVIAMLRMEFLVRRRQHVRALSAAAILRPREPMSATHTPSQYAPCVSPPSRDRSGVPPPAPPTTRPDGLARRLLRHDLRLDMPASPMSDYVRRSPYTPHSPREEVLSTPRGEVATAYLNKLDLVSRCLHRAMDATRDAP